jgi:hypothetical protein
VELGYKDVNLFGIYEYGAPGNKLTVFLGPDGVGDAAFIDFDPDNNFILDKVRAWGPGGITEAIFSKGVFGFWLTSPSGTFYSEDSLNPGGVPQALIYEGSPAWGDTGDFYVAFEDLPWMTAIETSRILSSWRQTLTRLLFLRQAR